MVDFLVIGPFSAYAYKNIFPLIKDQKIKLGYNRVGEFSDGIKFGNINWFTSFDVEEKGYLKLKEYKEGDYSKFDNYDAINIDRVEDIPDYDGVMGVPMTFLEKWNPEQFELIGFPDIGIVPEGWKGMTEEFVRLYYEQGNTGCYKEGCISAYFVKDGKAILPYVRLLIKKK